MNHPDATSGGRSALNRTARDLARYLIRHPADLAPVLSAAWRLRRRGWWRRFPYLPVPDPRYWEFRVATATGERDGVLDPQEVVAAARWSRVQSRGR